MDNFFVSCRTKPELEIETAFLVTLLQVAKDAGMKRVVGEYIPTSRNRSVAEFYAVHGFQPLKAGPQNGKSWQFDLARSIPALPDHLAVNVVRQPLSIPGGQEPHAEG